MGELLITNMLYYIACQNHALYLLIYLFLSVALFLVYIPAVSQINKDYVQVLYEVFCTFVINVKKPYAL